MIFNKDLLDKIDSENKSIKNEINLILQKNEDFQKNIIEKLNILDSKINSFDNNLNKLNLKFDEELKKIKNISLDLNKELEQIKLSKNTMVSKIYSDLSKELNDQMKFIKTDMNSYNNLKESFSKLLNESSSIVSNIEKLNKISKNINEIDFTMSRYSKQIDLSDKEKLRLMAQIESLQKVISAERKFKRKGFQN